MMCPLFAAHFNEYRKINCQPGAEAKLVLIMPRRSVGRVTTAGQILTTDIQYQTGYACGLWPRSLKYNTRTKICHLYSHG